MDLFKEIDAIEIKSKHNGSKGVLKLKKQENHKRWTEYVIQFFRESFSSLNFVPTFSRESSCGKKSYTLL
jgi:hypothetical protein